MITTKGQISKKAKHNETKTNSEKTKKNRKKNVTGVGFVGGFTLLAVGSYLFDWMGGIQLRWGGGISGHNWLHWHFTFGATAARAQ